VIWQNGKAVVQDRLGSVMARGNGTGGVETHDYFPYGEERTATVGDRNKFGTYHRDQTGLDYADQRYYDSAIGRFLTSDPYEASGGAAEPGSWGRGPYVEADPINLMDPTGEVGRCPVGTSVYRGKHCIGVYQQFGDNFGIKVDTDPDGSRQNNEPHSRSGKTKEEVLLQRTSQRFDKALGDATTALLKKPECKKLFSGLGAGADPVDVLNSIANGDNRYASVVFDKILEMPGTEGKQVTSAMVRRWETRTVDIGFGATQIVDSTVRITINLLAGTFQDGSDEDRAVTVLHELGHLFDYLFGAASTSIKGDERDPQLSQANSALVRKKCF
jgi:RHS repeat-associated protein